MPDLKKQILGNSAAKHLFLCAYESVQSNLKTHLSSPDLLQ